MSYYLAQGQTHVSQRKPIFRKQLPKQLFMDFLSQKIT